jgi:hypothetical protein
LFRPELDDLILASGHSGLRGWQSIGRIPSTATGTFWDSNLWFCANDAEAIEQAKRLIVNHAVELWSGERLVIRLEAKAK